MCVICGTEYCQIMNSNFGITQEQIVERMEHIKMNKYKQNQFYVGSPSVFTGRNWGHVTLNKAVEHAKNLMESEDKDEIFYR